MSTTTKQSKARKSKDRVGLAGVRGAQKPRWLEYAVAFTLAAVPLHAFLTVWASTVFGHYTLLRLWPELVMVALSVWFFASGQFPVVWRELSRRGLARVIAAYLLLNVVYYLVTLFRGEAGVQSASYGLLLNTRLMVWFVLVYAVARQSSWLAQKWQKIVFIPLGIVSVFALLQFFILPADWLRHFGYVKDITITPIQTINQDTSTVRAQSFLRGPNPLGAYVLLGIGLLWAVRLVPRRRVALLAASAAALVVSSSRSAWLGLVLAGTAWLGATRGFVRGRRTVMVALAGVLATLLVVILLLQVNEGVKNAVLHVNDKSTAAQTSNEDRLAALQNGVRDVTHEPLGRGLGTAGPASAYSQAGSRNSENYFLGIAQETGWLGLGLLLLFMYRVAMLLYRQKSAFSHMLFALFVGLTFVNILSYAWSDVTLVYLFWGLAAIALATKRPTHET